MEEKLEAAFGDQKRIFLIIFQRFIMILSEHLVKCDTDGRDYNTDWYRWTIGRLQQVFLTVRKLIFLYNLLQFSYFYCCSDLIEKTEILLFLIHSTMSKFVNIPVHWRVYCSLRSTLIFSMFSNNLWL
jgi:hypothetical protein